MAGYIGSKGSGIISGIGASIADLNLTDKSLANGTTEANKVLTADGDKDVTAIRNLTATGTVTAQGLTLDTTAVTATGTEINQLSAITRGSILYGNASGATARLTAGGAATVLTSDGTDLSWAAPAAPAAGGGSMEFIASSGALSSAADFAFTQFDSTKYCNYQFVLLNVKPDGSGVNFQPQARLAGTSNYDTGTNYAINTTVPNAAQSSFYTALSVSNGSSDVGINGVFHLYNPSENAYTTGQFLAVYTNSTQSIKYGAALGSAHVVAQVTDAIRFRFSSGNIASGTILMYGIKKS